MKKTYEFENLGCAHCAGKMEEKIGKLPDVESVNLSFPMKKMYVETSREDLLPEIQKICTDIEPDVIVTEVTKKSSKRRKHVEEDSHESHEHHHHHDHEHDHEHEHHHHHDHEHEHHHHHDHGHDHHHEHGPDCTCGCHDHDHEHGHHHADDVFTSWGTETPKKYEKAELDSILKKLSESEDYGKVLRSKGMLPCTDGTWMYFDLVPEEYEIREGSADFTGRICVIGSELKEDALKELFEV